MSWGAKSLVVVLGIFVLTAGMARADDDFQDISHADLTKAIAEKKAVLLDLNGTESYEKNHIPGAIDYAAKKEALKTALPADKATLIVAYCGSEQCNAWKDGAKAAKELGYTNIKHYKPGIKGWLASNKAPEAGAEANK